MSNRKDTGYYDFDLNFDELFRESSDFEELLSYRDLQQRKLFLNETIDVYSIEFIVKNILQFNREDKDIPVEERTPILLYITSNGGEVDVGFQLIDAIQNSKTPVYTINLGYQYSMALIVGLAGHKRFATRNAKFLMHDGSSFVYNSSAKAQDQMEFQARIEARTKEYILNRTKITSEEYDSKLRNEWYLFADEAKEKGITDFIIGEDCDIDEIV